MTTVGYNDNIVTQNENNTENDDDLYCYKEKRQPVKWTAEEEMILKDGIRKYGKGSWTKIIREFKDKLDASRRYRDLSDKIRLLEKVTSYDKRRKTNYWEVDDNNEPILNNMGEPIIYACKFPYEAAYKAAYAKNLRKGERVIKICYEEANQKWFHIYKAMFGLIGRKRIKVRKIAGQSLYRNDGI